MFLGSVGGNGGMFWWEAAEEEAGGQEKGTSVRGFVTQA